MPQGRYNVLFLSNRNTGRSIFAEAVMNRLGGQNFRGFSDAAGGRTRSVGA
jgi:protein-tyrosine-phosphatase